MEQQHISRSIGFSLVRPIIVLEAFVKWHSVRWWMVLVLFGIGCLIAITRNPGRVQGATREEQAQDVSNGEGHRNRAAAQPQTTARVYLPLAIRTGSTSTIAIGIYQPQSGTSGVEIDAYSQQFGKRPAFAWLPMTWQHLDGSYWQFDPQMLDEFRTRGIMPGLTWEPSKGPIESYADRQTAINQPDFSWTAIASGMHDQYITQFAKDAAAYHYPFILRMLHEMNGTWYPWGYGVNGNTNPADFVTAWTHIVNIFRQENATNVQFVWCPSAITPYFIQTYGDTLKQLYPGDNYVDWVALDGYSNAQNDYRSLQDEFQPSYDFITGFSARPMILFEVGSTENPTDPMAKANWITQGFLTTIPNQLPKVKVATWFNSTDDSGRDYSLQTSTNATNAWEQVVTSPLYQGSLW